MKIANAQLWVHDQDEALAFYTEKVGMEVRADVTVAEMGNFRWLTVGPAGQTDVSIVLMAIPGPPVFEPETSDQVEQLMAKGCAGTIFLTTDDAKGRTRISRAAASSSSTSPRSGPTGSTHRSAIRRATTCGSPRCGSWRTRSAGGLRRAARLRPQRRPAFHTMVTSRRWRRQYVRAR